MQRKKVIKLFISHNQIIRVAAVKAARVVNITNPTKIIKVKVQMNMKKLMNFKNHKVLNLNKLIIVIDDLLLKE